VFVCRVATVTSLNAIDAVRAIYTKLSCLELFQADSFRGAVTLKSALGDYSLGLLFGQ